MSGAARVLVVAKAPVPGRAKTRLGATLGHPAAAELAAAALLDTLAVCAEAFPERHLALDGDLATAVRGDELADAVVGWTVFPQAGADLGSRLAHAHATVAATGGGPVLQVGMDTPQITVAGLREVAARVLPGQAVLGPARDGGWWVLGLPGNADPSVLAHVPMSRPQTYQATADALAATGLVVHSAAVLRDVDTAADAAAVAAEAPGTRFARAWRPGDRAAG